jgi:hypothetical protein
MPAGRGVLKGLGSVSTAALRISRPGVPPLGLRLGVGALVAATAVLGGQAAAGSRGEILCLAVLLAVAIWHFPAATVLLPLSVAQEIDPSVPFENAGEWFYFGNQIYYGFRFPALVVLTIIVGMFLVIRHRPQLQARGRWVGVFMAALAVWSVTYAVASGASVAFSVSSLARPFVAGLFAFVIGLCLSTDSRGQNVALGLAAVGLFAWGAWGLTKAIQGQS